MGTRRLDVVPTKTISTVMYQQYNSLKILCQNITNKIHWQIFMTIKIQLIMSSLQIYICQQ